MITIGVTYNEIIRKSQTYNADQIKKLDHLSCDATDGY